MLGGVLALDEPAMSRWGRAGTWQYPVGDPHRMGQSRVPGAPGFQLSRGVQRSHGRVTHQGADLTAGRAGDTVYAAASGIVMLACNEPNGNGYGAHVVLAHRLEDERLAYTVYAHLQRGSACWKPGDLVCSGDPLGLVGSTGRARTPHLHFEVRLPRSPEERWENAAVEEPLDFAEARFTEPPPHAGSLARYLAWARGEALLPDSAAAAAVLTRDLWWSMLARAAGPAGSRTLRTAAQLRDTLIAEGLLPEEEFGAPPNERLSWNELARDVKRLRQAGVRPPHGPLVASEHEAECAARFGERHPSAHPRSLRRLADDPTVGDACILLADLAGPLVSAELRAEAPPAKSKVRRVRRLRR